MSDAQKLPDLIEKCEQCENGSVMAQEWLDWNQKTDELVAAGDRLSDAIAKVQMPQTPEYITCVECEGTGWIATAAGQQISELFQKCRFKIS